MDQIKRLYGQLNLTGGQWQEIFVDFVAKNKFDTESILYRHVVESKPREQNKNGYFHEWQRDEIIKLHNEGYSLQEIHDNFVTKWHREGLINKLWTTNYKYKYNLPPIERLEYLINEEERFKNLVKRNIAYYFKKLYGNNKIYKQFLKEAGYCNATSKPLKQLAVVETGIIMDVPKESEKISMMQDMLDYINSLPDMRQDIPGKLAIVYEKYDGDGIRLVYRLSGDRSKDSYFENDESRADRIYITSRDVYEYNNLVKQQGWVRKGDPDHEAAYNFYLKMLNKYKLDNSPTA